MDPVTLSHPNGATFTCRTKEQLDQFLAAGWVESPPTQPASAVEQREVPATPRSDKPKTKG